MFCTDGGMGIWPRTEKLISELGLSNAKQVLDYTHTKQNISAVISDALKLPDKQSRKLSKQIRALLWPGDINGIIDIVKNKLKKLHDYFGKI